MPAKEQSITPDQIRQRAYELWDRNHQPPDMEIEFWIMAERELRAENKRAQAQPHERKPAEE